MQTDEQEMIARILDGHIEDFGYFLERYSQEAFAIVVRLVPRQEDAEELVQDAFVRAFNRLETFERRSSFSTWICRIAYTTAVSWLRKRRMKYLSIDEQPKLTDAEITVLGDYVMYSILSEADRATAKAAFEAALK